MDLGIPLNYILKEELGLCSTTKESKQILLNKECFVDGKPIKNIHYLVGLMGVVSFPKIEKYFRVVLNQFCKLEAIEIPAKEANIKISKIKNKTIVNGKKLQVNLNDGRNILVEKDVFDKYKTSDSLLIELPSQKVVKHIPFEEGVLAMLMGGRHAGAVGKIEKIEGRKILFNKSGQNYETLKKFVLVMGKDKSEVHIKK
jgi:small subunit ribosomal protein S4e